MSERRITVLMNLYIKYHHKVLYQKVKPKKLTTVFFALLNSHFTTKYLTTYLLRMPFSWGITPLIAACKQKTEKTFKETEKCSGVEWSGVENTVKENKYTLKI